MFVERIKKEKKRSPATTKQIGVILGLATQDILSHLGCNLRSSWAAGEHIRDSRPIIGHVENILRSTAPTRNAPFLSGASTCVARRAI